MATAFQGVLVAVLLLMGCPGDGSERETHEALNGQAAQPGGVRAVQERLEDAGWRLSAPTRTRQRATRPPALGLAVEPAPVERAHDGLASAQQFSATAAIWRPAVALRRPRTVSAATGETWGPFRGRFIDVETGQGIAGGVVLAVWERAYPTLAGTVSEFYEAREAVSTADGLFELPRLDPPFFRLNVRAPAFQFFAPGYGMVRWVVTPEGGDPFVDPTVIEMRPVKTREERLKVLQKADSASAPAERRCKLTAAVNQERARVGLKSMYPECGK